jgi:hypothetical protein
MSCHAINYFIKTAQSRPRKKLWFVFDYDRCLQNEQLVLIVNNKFNDLPLDFKLEVTEPKRDSSHDESHEQLYDGVEEPNEEEVIHH